MVRFFFGLLKQSDPITQTVLPHQPIVYLLKTTLIHMFFVRIGEVKQPAQMKQRVAASAECPEFQHIYTTEISLSPILPKCAWHS